MTISVCLFQTEIRFIHKSPIEVELCVEIEIEEESEKEVETDEFIYLNLGNKLEINRYDNKGFSNITCLISHHLNIESPPPELV